MLLYKPISNHHIIHSLCILIFWSALLRRALDRFIHGMVAVLHRCTELRRSTLLAAATSAWLLGDTWGSGTTSSTSGLRWLGSTARRFRWFGSFLRAKMRASGSHRIIAKILELIDSETLYLPSRFVYLGCVGNHRYFFTNCLLRWSRSAATGFHFAGCWLLSAARSWLLSAARSWLLYTARSRWRRFGHGLPWLSEATRTVGSYLRIAKYSNYFRHRSRDIYLPGHVGRNSSGCIGILFRIIISLGGRLRLNRRHYALASRIFRHHFVSQLIAGRAQDCNLFSYLICCVDWSNELRSNSKIRP
jgi:hypothetical protein